jgi:hypothetical protein
LRRILRERKDAKSRYMAGLCQAMIITLLVLGLGAPNFLDPLHLYVLGLMIGHGRAMEQDQERSRYDAIGVLGYQRRRETAESCLRHIRSEETPDVYSKHIVVSSPRLLDANLSAPDLGRECGHTKGREFNGACED